MPFTPLGKNSQSTVRAPGRGLNGGVPIWKYMHPDVIWAELAKISYIFYLRMKTVSHPQSTSALSFPAPVRSNGASWAVAASASVCLRPVPGPSPEREQQGRWGQVHD